MSVDTAEAHSATGALARAVPIVDWARSGAVQASSCAYRIFGTCCSRCGCGPETFSLSERMAALLIGLLGFVQNHGACSGRANLGNFLRSPDSLKRSVAEPSALKLNYQLTTSDRSAGAEHERPRSPGASSSARPIPGPASCRTASDSRQGRRTRRRHRTPRLRQGERLRAELGAGRPAGQPLYPVNP